MTFMFLLVKTPNINIPFEKGIKMVEKGLNPLGKEYLNIFKKVLKDGWVDIYMKIKVKEVELILLVLTIPCLMYY